MWKTIGRPAVAALACLFLLTSAPAGIAEDPLEIASGYRESFDLDGGEWIASPLQPPHGRGAPVSSWEWGRPTSGPAAAHSGEKVWATNLTGTYGRQDCAGIMSPPIDLTGVAEASLSFMLWKHSRASTLTIYDGGALFVTEDAAKTLHRVTPAAGWDGQARNRLANCIDSLTAVPALGGPVGSTPPGPQYDQVTVDLSDFLGKTIRFVIAFGSDSITRYDGWYVDDFTVTSDGQVTVEDFEDSDGGFTVVGTKLPYSAQVGWTHGTPDPYFWRSSPSPMWGTNVTGAFGAGECASLTSPPIPLRLPAVPTDKTTAQWSWDHVVRGNIHGIVQVGVHTADGIDFTYVVPEGGYNDMALLPDSTSCLGPEAGAGVFTWVESEWDPDMKRRTVDLSPFMGEVVSLRFLFNSPMRYTAEPYDMGWYIDNVGVEVDAGQGTQRYSRYRDLVAPDDAPGWRHGGIYGTWGYGIPQGTHGDKVYATNLEGDHGFGECSWIQSPSVPGAVFAERPELAFRHWHAMDERNGAARSGGALLVSPDDGRTWEYVTTPEYRAPAGDVYGLLDDCIRGLAPDAPAVPWVFTGAQMDYEWVTVDLSQYAEAPLVKVRFVMAGYSSHEQRGWYIEDVRLGGIDLL